MKKGLGIGDIHAGSIFGMLPSAFETSEHAVCLQNPGQEYLWNCWIDFCNRAEQFDPDFVIVNGDVVEGKQSKQRGVELKLNLMVDQQRAAIDTLMELKRHVGSDCKWYFTQGSCYHVGDAAEHEERVAQALGGQKYNSVGTGRYVREVLWLGVEGVTIEASHHISPTTGFYRLTALDREGQWSAMAAKDATKGIPKADFLIRSHVHYFAYGEHESKQILVLPAWQLQTRYMRKNSVYRMLPSIGGVKLIVDGEAKRCGEAPVTIRKVLYGLPPIRVTQLDE